MPQRKHSAVIIPFLFVAINVCNINCTEQETAGSLTTTVYPGNPDIFMMGQSNANADLAEEIEIQTGRTIHQISHGGQPIKNWVSDPYNWLEMDDAFLGSRTFRYFVWFQGEANAKGSLQNYEHHLKSIIQRICPNYSPTVIIVGIWRDDEDVSSFRSFQQTMCTNNINYHFVDSIDCHRSDGIHLSSIGQRKLAIRIGRLIDQIELQQ